MENALDKEKGIRMKNKGNLDIVIICFGFFIIAASIIFLSNSLSIVGSAIGFLLIIFSKDVAKYLRR